AKANLNRRRARARTATKPLKMVKPATKGNPTKRTKARMVRALKVRTASAVNVVRATKAKRVNKPRLDKKLKRVRSRARPKVINSSQARLKAIVRANKAISAVAAVRTVSSIRAVKILAAGG